MTDSPMLMTKDEEEIIKLQKKIGKLQTKLWKMTEAIKDVCTHSKVEDWKYTKSNGFGSRRDYVGKRCVICNAKDYYNNGHFTHYVYVDPD